MQKYKTFDQFFEALYFREPHKINGHQARWLEFLQDVDYQLEHILGSFKTIADLLSCHKDLNKGVNM